MRHGILYPCHPSWLPHWQGDTGNKPSASAPPSTERAGGFQSQKGCLWGGVPEWVLLSCRSLGCLHTDKLRAESGGWSPKCPDCESLQGGRLSDYCIILGWTLWAGQLFGRGCCGNPANVTYLWVPRSSGRDEQRLTVRKRNLGTLHRPQAVGCLSRWKSLHHTEQQWPDKRGASSSSPLT